MRERIGRELSRQVEKGGSASAAAAALLNHAAIGTLHSLPGGGAQYFYRLD